MNSAQDSLELLKTMSEATFQMSDTGRIMRENDPDDSPGPRLFMAGCTSGNVVLLRHDVRDETADAVLALSRDEPPLKDPGSMPVHLSGYARLLGAEMPVRQQAHGVSFLVPTEFKHSHDVELVCSGTLAGDQLLSKLELEMPADLLALGFRNPADIWEPWCAALHGQRIASLGFTARLGRNGAESGVVSVPGLRGRGFAAAVVAGWAKHPALRNRTLFYSADHSNMPSRRVAAKLGLTFIGATLRMT